MTSKDIYVSSKAMPYVYRVENIETGEFYIGYRKANVKKNMPSQIDFPKYRTSKSEIRDNFDTFNWQIIAEFFTENDAYDFEQQLIFENWQNTLLLNESCFHGKKRFKCDAHTEITKNKISLYNIGKIIPTNVREKISKSSIGKKMSNDAKMKMSLSKKGLKSPNLGKRASNETRRKQSESRKLHSGPNKGKKFSDEYCKKLSDAHKGQIPVNKGIKCEIVECPWCGKLGGLTGMKSRHFNHCKYRVV